MSDARGALVHIDSSFYCFFSYVDYSEILGFCPHRHETMH